MMGFKEKIADVRDRVQIELDVTENKRDEDLQAFRAAAVSYNAFDIINLMPGMIREIANYEFQIAALKEQLKLIDEIDGKTAV